MEGRVNVWSILTGYAGANTGGREAASDGRGGMTCSVPALYTEAVLPGGPGPEPRTPFPDQPQRYGTTSGFHLLIGLISPASLSPRLALPPYHAGFALDLT